MIKGLGKGGCDVPSMVDCREFDTIEDASKAMAEQYQNSYKQLMLELRDYKRKYEETKAKYIDLRDTSN